MNVIKNNLDELAKHNYKYIEIIAGNKQSKNIFNSKIDKKKFIKLLTFFKKEYKDKEFNHLISKNYYKNNVRLQVNEKYQQRCFQMSLLDWDVLSTNIKTDYLIKFGERKMISIENFPTISKYDNEVMRESISFNIKNKFYLNFTHDENDNKDKDNNNHTYNISLFITKKNGKTKYILQLIEQYLQLIDKLLQHN